jgi:bacterioferritin
MGRLFLTDIKELRSRARSRMEEGAATEGYRADRETVLRMLIDALSRDERRALRKSAKS